MRFMILSPRGSLGAFPQAAKGCGDRAGEWTDRAICSMLDREGRETTCPVKGRIVAERPAVLAEGITKSFGKVRALDGIDLAVQPATVFGLLGPNGAGKTPAVRIFTTLLAPDTGR